MESLIAWSDADFKALFARDESQALGLVLDAFGTDASAYAASICGRSDAEDAAQEAFIDLMLLARKGKIDGGVKGLILTLVRRRSIDLLRRRESRLRRAFRWQKSRKQVEAPEPMKEPSEMDAAIAKLNDKEREIIHLRFRSECSTKECAEVLGIAEGTIKSRLSRAIATLKSELGVTGQKASTEERSASHE